MKKNCLHEILIMDNQNSLTKTFGAVLRILGQFDLLYEFEMFSIIK